MDSSLLSVSCETIEFDSVVVAKIDFSGKDDDADSVERGVVELFGSAIYLVFSSVSVASFSSSPLRGEGEDEG